LRSRSTLSQSRAAVVMAHGATPTRQSAHIGHPLRRAIHAVSFSGAAGRPKVSPAGRWIAHTPAERRPGMTTHPGGHNQLLLLSPCRCGSRATSAARARSRAVRARCHPDVRGAADRRCRLPAWRVSPELSRTLCRCACRPEPDGRSRSSLTASSRRRVYRPVAHPWNADSTPALCPASPLPWFLPPRPPDPPHPRNASLPPWVHDRRRAPTAPPTSLPVNPRSPHQPPLEGIHAPSTSSARR